MLSFVVLHLFSCYILQLMDQSKVPFSIEDSTTFHLKYSGIVLLQGTLDCDPLIYSNYWYSDLCIWSIKSGPDLLQILDRINQKIRNSIYHIYLGSINKSVQFKLSSSLYFQFQPCNQRNSEEELQKTLQETKSP